MPIPKPHYPLMDHAAEQLHAASGRPLHDLTLDQVMAGELSPEDLQVHAQTLQAQATVAREAGFAQLAENLERAAELTAVPNEELLRMYTLLRPGRATYDELVTLAQTLANTYAAPRTAAWVQEAAEVYRMRGLAKRTTN